MLRMMSREGSGCGITRRFTIVGAMVDEAI